jgi:hypothetical protein
MILEAVQMLCTTKHLVDPEDDSVELYRPTHVNHPVTIWMRQSQENYLWTLNMVDAMHTEWKYRYGHPESKTHKSYELARQLSYTVPDADKFPQRGLTEFAQAMPDEYKRADPVEAYRVYYQSDMKQKFAAWKNRRVPAWYQRKAGELK